MLDLTEFILGFLIPAVSQFPYDLVNTWHGIPLEEIMTGKIVSTTPENSSLNREGKMLQVLLAIQLNKKILINNDT